MAKSKHINMSKPIIRQKSFCPCNHQKYKNHPAITIISIYNSISEIFHPSSFYSFISVTSPQSCPFIFMSSQSVERKKMTMPTKAVGKSKNVDDWVNQANSLTI